jgi:regulator of RNase E activity RraA
VKERVDGDLLASLARYDTPTLCNAMERVDPGRQGTGFTRRPLHCVHPALPPIVGFARTARIRAAEPSGRDPAREREVELAYYRHMAEPPGPRIAVVEDLDPEPVGAWWGEVNTNLHRGLGCLGVLTNGIARDLPQMARHFQVLAGGVAPSHAHVHVVEVGCPVTVAGLRVAPGDLLHADCHGALSIPLEAAAALPEAAERVIAEERVLIEASKREDFGIDVLERLLSGSDH